jgi:outer membrane protein OmpA-like peptidoglycan-associated protein
MCILRPTSLRLCRFLKNNSDVSVEVGGHTNNNPTDKYANELSTNRAKSVADWLIAQGIPSNRVQYKGYGKTQPIMPNTNAEGRRKNQRVEIKILNING